MTSSRMARRSWSIGSSSRRARRWRAVAVPTLVIRITSLRRFWYRLRVKICETPVHSWKMKPYGTNAVATPESPEADRVFYAPTAGFRRSSAEAGCLTLWLDPWERRVGCFRENRKPSLPGFALAPVLNYVSHIYGVETAGYSYMVVRSERQLKHTVAT